jgi:hypothetical protein
MCPRATRRDRESRCRRRRRRAKPSRSSLACRAVRAKSISPRARSMCRSRCACQSATVGRERSRALNLLRRTLSARDLRKHLLHRSQNPRRRREEPRSRRTGPRSFSPIAFFVPRPLPSRCPGKDPVGRPARQSRSTMRARRRYRPEGTGQRHPLKPCRHRPCFRRPRGALPLRRHLRRRPPRRGHFPRPSCRRGLLWRPGVRRHPVAPPPLPLPSSITPKCPKMGGPGTAKAGGSAGSRR